ncbi:MAG: LysR family transcriptional regulator [Pseudomonadota bacterium]
MPSPQWLGEPRNEPLGTDPARHRPSLRELEVLIAVIETGKTTAAAHRLGISQPAVSRALVQLESAVGRRLFERQGGRLTATSDAVALAAEAGPIFSILSRISSRDWQAPDADSLRIVAPPTVAHRFLDGVVPAFSADHPETHIHIEVSTSSDVVNAVAEGQADIGVADAVFRHPGVRRIGFLKTAAQAILPVGDPLAERASVTPADLDGRPFVALTRRFSSRTLVERAFEEARARLEIVAEVATSAIAVQLIAGGMGGGRGVGVVNPFPVALRPVEGIRFVPFAPEIGYEAAFLTSVGRPSEAAMRFMDHVRRQPLVERLAQAGIAASLVGEPASEGARC